MNARLDPQSVARALGGDASGSTVRAPSPGQKPSDRSLKIEFGDDLSDGFNVTDYYGSGYSWEDLKDYVRDKVGEPVWNERNPKVDHVARMNARAMGYAVRLDLNTA